MPKPKDTSWENVAGWYNELLQSEGTYQKELILPNLLRLMEIKKGERVLDLACGQGFFANEFLKAGALVTGADASAKLIALAKSNSRNSPDADFRVASADSLQFIKNKSIDKAAIVLALQNIADVNKTLAECARALKSGGVLYIVLNHPAFRIPKRSSWGWDEKTGKNMQNTIVQYRRIDNYLSEAKILVQMHPGDKPDEHTPSFHRPLQFYFKALRAAGFSVTALEEWNSHRESEPGPRAKAENIARKEIPLFLCLVAKT